MDLYRAASGGSGGGSSGGGVNSKNIDRFVKNFNTNMKNTTGGYYENAGLVDQNILLGSNGNYSFADAKTIGGLNAWYGPLLREIYADPYLTADEQAYLIENLGLLDPRTIERWDDKNENNV
jgi:hypothetical protein